MRENLTLVHLNNTGSGPSSYLAAQSDQRLYCSLMESIISKLFNAKFHFSLVAQTGLSLTQSETRKIDFLPQWPYCIVSFI